MDGSWVVAHRDLADFNGCNHGGATDDEFVQHYGYATKNYVNLRHASCVYLYDGKVSCGIGHLLDVEQLLDDGATMVHDEVSSIGIMNETNSKILL